jgi:hypothetical protein
VLFDKFFELTIRTFIQVSGRKNMRHCFRGFAHSSEEVASLTLDSRQTDKSLEDSANLPEPDVIAAEIAEDLQAALNQFAQPG